MSSDRRLERLLDMVERVCRELRVGVPPQREMVDEMKELAGELRSELLKPGALSD
jgi:hypothetical protein